MPGQVDQEDPGVGAVARDVRAGRQRRVRRPAGLRRAEEHRRVEDDAAGEVQPVGQRVQPRERHVARADLQRHEVVGEPRPQRHDDEEDHRRAVHREDLVVDLRRQQRVVRLGELRAHQQRLDAAEHHERERGDQVEDPDALVVGRRDPADPRPRAAHRRGWRRSPRAAAAVRARRCCSTPDIAAQPLSPGIGGRACLRARRLGDRAASACVTHARTAAGRDAADLGEHVGVVAPAQLGALAAVDAGSLAAETTCG